MRTRGCAVLTVALLAGLACGGHVRAQPPPGGQPWNHDLYVLEAPDGLTFGEPRLFVERGGVASLVRLADGRLLAAFQWFPFDRPEAFDRIAVATCHDARTWTAPQPIEVQGLPPGYVRPCDPTLVLLPDNRVRLYFTSHGLEHDAPATYSAVSADGLRYSFEPGVRFGVPGQPVLDCAVARHGEAWHYYAPVPGQPGRGYHATSADGLQFERLADVAIPGDRQWLGCVVARDAGLRFYGSGPGVWSAVSGEGSRWELEAGSRALGADPAVAHTADGGWVMIVTGGPRADSLGPASSGPAAVAAGESGIFIVCDGVLYQVDPQTLGVIRRVPLP